MRPIEYRFLQLILSHVSGDRLTLALVHWDGERLRVASSFAPLSRQEVPQADIVRRTVQAKLERAARQAEQAPPGLGLKEAVPVREGLGASPFWSPVRTSLASDPEAQFEELCETLRLAPHPASAIVH